MVYVYLQGGLGNQMFQYAFGRQLQQLRNDRLVIDDQHFAKAHALGETPRTLELSEWNTSFELADEPARRYVRKTLYPPVVHRVWQKITGLRPYSIYNDETPLDLAHVSRASLLYLQGYFQREDYFASIRQELLSEFTLRYTPQRRLTAGDHSVSVHVRRGDYVHLPQAAAHHGACSEAYYLRAMQYMREQLGTPRFYFFSDDIAWCKETFTDADIEFVVSPPDAPSSEDMYLMSRCAHHIIANSSYSWWGAWLNPSAQKIVIAPARWTNEQTTERNHYVPKNWIQLS